MGPGWAPEPGNFSSVWRDTWTLLSEDVSEDRDMVYLPRRQSIVVFGAILTAWTLALNLLLLLVLCRRRCQRGPGLLLPGNLVLASLLTGAFVVPFSVRTESVGGWTLGLGTCRAWLLARVALSALTAWSVLAIVVDRLVYAVNPAAYLRRMTCGSVAALLVLCWLAAVGAASPAAWFMATDPDFVLAEVCAVAVDAHYAIGVSLASFLVPSVLALLFTTALVTLALCARSRPAVAEDTDGDAGQTQPCCPEREDDVSDTAPEYTTGNAATVGLALTASLVALWTPFYVFSLTVPFCKTLCVNPAIWSLCEWLGFATSGVAPALLVLDTRVRDNIRSLVSCRKSSDYYREKCTTEWRVRDDSANDLKPCLQNK